jgi:hypothetical protein
MNQSSPYFYLISLLTLSLSSFPTLVLHSFMERGIQVVELLTHAAGMSLNTFFHGVICVLGVGVGRIRCVPVDQIGVLLGRGGRG